MADYNDLDVKMAFSELGEKMRGMMVWFWLTFFLGFLIFPPIVFIIKYFGYLSKLKRCGELTEDENLEKAYKMELWALLLSIIMPIIIAAVYLPAIMGGDLTSMTMMIILGLILVLSVPFILRYISSSALKDWADSLAAQDYSFNTEEIARGAAKIKTGTILSIIPFVNIIGVILYYSGFSKMGRYLQAAFGGVIEGYEEIDDRRRRPPPIDDTPPPSPFQPI